MSSSWGSEENVYDSFARQVDEFAYQNRDVSCILVGPMDNICTEALGLAMRRSHW